VYTRCLNFEPSVHKRPFADGRRSVRFRCDLQQSVAPFSQRYLAWCRDSMIATVPQADPPAGHSCRRRVAPPVRAHLLELDGRRGRARADYRTAARLTTSLPERRYLLDRADRLEPDPP
jgi:hypothetical protein